MRLPCLHVCIHHVHVCEAQREREKTLRACVCVRLCECVCSRRDYEEEHCGGFSSLQGGGEVDFFPHPFFMAFFLSDLQPLYIRLAGRFSFIFKLLGGTHSAFVSCGTRRRRWAGWVSMEVKVETCCLFFFFNQSLMTISVLTADMARFLTEVGRLCCLFPQ